MRLSLLITVWLLLSLSGLGIAGVSLQQVGELHYGGEFAGLVAVGDRLYVTDQWGLEIFDVSDPVRPRLLGEIGLPGINQRLLVNGDYAYVESFYTGVHVVYVDDPGHPQLVRSIELPLGRGDVNGMQLAGDTLILNASKEFYPGGAWGSFLYFVDITEPSNAHIVQEIPHESQSFFVRGNLVYLLRFDRLTTLDISDPLWPHVLSIISLPNQSGEIAMATAGDRLIIAGEMGVSVWSLQDPARPKQIGFYGVQSRVFDAVAIPELLALEIAGQGLQLFDLSDPTSPRPLDTLSSFSVWGMALDEHRLYFVDTQRQVQILDVSEPEAPESLGQITPRQTGLLDVVVWNHWAYVTDLLRGLLVIDVQDPTQPVQVGLLPLTYSWPYDGATKLAIQPPWLYLTYAQSLLVISLEEPTQPQIVGEVNLGLRGDGLDVADGIAYVGLEAAQLALVDVRNPQTPMLLGTKSTGPGRGRDVRVRGRYVYLAHEDGGLTVLERIGEGAAVELAVVATLDTQGYAESVALSGDRALIADAYSGLTLVDLSGLPQLDLLGVYPGGSRENSVTLIGGYALLGTERDVQVWNLRSAEFPRLVSTSLPTSTYGLYVQGSWVFACGESAFQVLRFQADPFVDLDGDERTTPSDVAILLERLLEGDAETMLPDADLDQDGRLTLTDAALLLNAGEGNLPFVWSTGLVHALGQQKSPPAGPAEISLGFGGGDFRAAGWTIRYAPTEATPLVDSIRWHLPETALFRHLAEPGEIRFAVVSQEPLPAVEPWVTIRWEGKEGAEIRVEDVWINDGTLSVEVPHFRLHFEPPPKFAFLPPYPNPASQGMWLPFALPEAALVQVWISTFDGRPVRRLAVSAEEPGNYVDTLRALFWDGRNEQGERVAVGVYRVTLEAAGQRYTRAVATR